MSLDSPSRVPHPSGAAGQPAAAPPEPLHLRFSLRHAFWLVTLLGILLAGMVTAGGITSLVLLLMATVVALHVTGTVVGNRLQTHADQCRAWRAAQGTQADPPPDRSALATSTAPAACPELPLPGPLAERESARAWKWLPLAALAGAVVGGCGGAVLLEMTIGPRTSVLGTMVGSVSLAVLGGWSTFLIGSLWGIVRHGWSRAAAGQKQDEASRRAHR